MLGRTDNRSNPVRALGHRVAGFGDRIVVHCQGPDGTFGATRPADFGAVGGQEIEHRRDKVSVAAKRSRGITTNKPLHQRDGCLRAFLFPEGLVRLNAAAQHGGQRSDRLDATRCWGGQDALDSSVAKVFSDAFCLQAASFVEFSVDVTRRVGSLASCAVSDQVNGHERGAPAGSETRSGLRPSIDTTRADPLAPTVFASSALSRRLLTLRNCETASRGVSRGVRPSTLTPSGVVAGSGSGNGVNVER